MKKLFFGLGLFLLAGVLWQIDGNADEKKEWISLFNGRDLSGWTNSKGETPKGWEIRDGAIYRFEKGDNLHTEAKFLNFELEFEWKIAEGVNSGVKYRFHDGVGPEYQIIDDAAVEQKSKPDSLTAALYVIKAPENKHLKPAGEWNRGRIVARGNHLEHWLNGEKVLEIEVGSEDWSQRKAASKFKQREGFATFEGPIHLQDHGGAIWFREIRIRRFD